MSAARARAPACRGALARAASSSGRRALNLPARHQHAGVRDRVVRARGRLGLNASRAPVGLARPLQISAGLGALAQRGVAAGGGGVALLSPRGSRRRAALGRGGRRRRGAAAPGGASAPARSVAAAEARRSVWPASARRAPGPGRPGDPRKAGPAHPDRLLLDGAPGSDLQAALQHVSQPPKSPASAVTAWSASSASIEPGSRAIARSSNIPASSRSARRRAGSPPPPRAWPPARSRARLSGYRPRTQSARARRRAGRRAGRELDEPLPGPAHQACRALRCRCRSAAPPPRCPRRRPAHAGPRAVGELRPARRPWRPPSPVATSPPRRSPPASPRPRAPRRASPPRSRR